MYKYLFLFLSTLSFSQTKTITGVVSDTIDDQQQEEQHESFLMLNNC